MEDETPIQLHSLGYTWTCCLNSPVLFCMAAPANVYVCLLLVNSAYLYTTYSNSLLSSQHFGIYFGKFELNMPAMPSLPHWFQKKFEQIQLGVLCRTRMFHMTSHQKALYAQRRYKGQMTNVRGVISTSSSKLITNTKNQSNPNHISNNYQCNIIVI